MADEAAVIEPKPDAAVAPPPDTKKPAETTKISLDPGAKPIDVLGQIGELGKGAERAGEQVKALDLEAMKLNMPQLQTAPKPTPKLTKPEDMWASAAMIFAALGSVLSRRHASTALNAAATVLDTFKKNDKEATELAFSTWKAENENYMKVANFQMQAYNAAMGQIDKRKAEAIRAGSAQDKTAEAKLKALSHAFEDPAMLRELERGGLAAAMELQQTREKQKLALDKNSGELERKYAIYQKTQAMYQSDEYKAAVAAKDQYTLARLWSETGDPDGMKAFQKVMANQNKAKTKAQLDADRQARLEEMRTSEEFKNASPQQQLEMRAAIGDPSAIKALDRAKSKAEYDAEYAQREAELVKSPEWQEASVDQRKQMLAEIGSKKAAEVLAGVATQNSSRSGANINVTPTPDNPYGLTEAERKQAEEIAKYRQAMPSSSRDIRSRLIRTEVARLNPDWNEGLSRARLKGWDDWLSPQKKGGQQIVALNTFTQHLNTLRDMTKRLDNGDFAAVNALKNKVSDWMGEPEVKEFEAGRQFIAGEMVKLLASVGGVSERAEAAHAFSLNGSPRQQEGVINRAEELAAGRLMANVGSFKQQTGASLDDFKTLLSDDTKERFEKYLKDKKPGEESTKPTETAKQGEAPKAEATFPAEQLPRLQEAAKNGKGIRLEDGTVWGFVNGKPVQMRKW